MPRLTEFGKAVRIARINKDMKLLDMSLFIGYSPQFVGAVEYGKKKIPNDYVALIVNKCSFLPDDVRNICNAYGKELNNDKT